MTDHGYSLSLVMDELRRLRPELLAMLDMLYTVDTPHLLVRAGEGTITVPFIVRGTRNDLAILNQVYVNGESGPTWLVLAYATETGLAILDGNGFVLRRFALNRPDSAARALAELIITN